LKKLTALLSSAVLAVSAISAAVPQTVSAATEPYINYAEALQKSLFSMSVSRQDLCRTGTVLNGVLIQPWTILSQAAGMMPVTM
jgi:hypothetical protein